MIMVWQKMRGDTQMKKWLTRKRDWLIRKLGGIPKEEFNTILQTLIMGRKFPAANHIDREWILKCAMDIRPIVIPYPMKEIKETHTKEA